MPEFFKRVVCTEFQLTPAEKERIVKGDNILFDGQPIKHLGGGRFHVLVHIGDRLVPINETQWLVKNNPGIEIYHNAEFHAKFVAREEIDPVAIKAKLDEAVAIRKNITKNELPNT